MEETSLRAPLFRDPIYDGAADPTVIWNSQAQEWWMIYTNRRATAEELGVAWVHGTDPHIFFISPIRIGKATNLFL